jgi:hypothetical protein
MSDYEGSRSELLKILAELGEQPAFIARGKAADEALERLLESCRARREELLEWPRRHLATLAAQIGGDWRRIAPLLARPETAAELEALHSQRTLAALAPTSWPATDRGCLRQFLESAQRFNRAWRTYLAGLDYEAVNQPRRDYNRYYPLEKACAFATEMIGEEFEPLEMIDGAFLEKRFPYLPVPELV